MLLSPFLSPTVTLKRKYLSLYLTLYLTVLNFTVQYLYYTTSSKVLLIAFVYFKHNRDKHIFLNVGR